MTPTVARLSRTRRRLGAAAALRPLLLALGGALALVALAGLVARWQGEAATAGRIVAILVAVTAVALLVVGGLLGLRAWRRATAAHAALWIERRLPGLDYALVTLADPRAHVSDALRARLESRVTRARWEPLVTQATVRALAWPALAAVGGVMLLAVAPAAAARARAAGVARDGGGTAPAAARGARAASLDIRVRIIPPAYSRLSARDLGAVANVAALEGSTIELRGSGDAATLRAVLDAPGGAVPVEVSMAGDGWRMTLAMPARATVMRLARRDVRRLLVLEPRADSTPTLTLRLPTRDTVLSRPRGAMALAADGRDDLGMANGWLEFIVSSGEGESFRFRTGTLGARRLDGARAATLSATLDLATLALEPGDIVHLRAVARDANPRGAAAVSETRTLRVMRRGEADSVAVEAAPPPEADKSLLSQRMLIRLTEALVARAPRLERARLVDESRRIAADQKRVRRAVGDVVFSRLGGEGSAEHAHGAGDGHDHSADELAALRTPAQVLAAADRATGRGTEAALDFEGDETPVVAINRPLLEAYNAMWEASLALDVAEPREALPPMRRALEAIQRARAAERVYLRGRPPAVVVDLARVRLAGQERGESNVRAPREPLGDVARAIAVRLEGAALLAQRDASAAADTLLLLRVESLGAPEGVATLTRALGEAAEALRRGGDATAALVRARRAAIPGSGVRDAPGAWRGAWPVAGGT